MWLSWENAVLPIFLYKGLIFNTTVKDSLVLIDVRNKSMMVISLESTLSALAGQQEGFPALY